MGIVIVDHKLTKEDIRLAREDYDSYIKITADIRQNIVAIGGEYHADAEKILVEKYDSKNEDIWGGGYDVEEKKYKVSAMLNIKPNFGNDSMDILDPEIRRLFLDSAKSVLVNIESLA